MTTFSNRIFQAIPDSPDDNGGAMMIKDPDAAQPVTELELRLDLRNHSPTGFAWGYGGSGPAQLALAMLAEVADDDAALLYYHDFKDEWISIQQGRWSMPEVFIQGWIKGRRRRRQHDAALAR